MQLNKKIEKSSLSIFSNHFMQIFELLLLLCEYHDIPNTLTLKYFHKFYTILTVKSPFSDIDACI